MGKPISKLVKSANSITRKHFGGKPLAIIATTSSYDAMRAGIRDLQRRHKKIRGYEEHINSTGGTAIPLDKTGKKYLIYVKPTYTGVSGEVEHTHSDGYLEAAFGHEIHHGYYARHRLSKGKRVYRIANETSAYLQMFEILLKRDPKEYKAKLDAGKKYYKIGEENRSSNGFALAATIQELFGPKERKTIIQELINKDFQTTENIVSMIIRRAEKKKIKPVKLFNLYNFLLQRAKQRNAKPQVIKKLESLVEKATT